MPDYTQDFTTIPYGPLGIIALPGCEELAEKIDRYIVKWRAQKQSEHKNSIAFAMTRTSTILFLTLLTPLFFIFVTSTIPNIIDLLYPSANKDDS